MDRVKNRIINLIFRRSLVLCGSRGMVDGSNILESTSVWINHDENMAIRYSINSFLVPG